MRVVSKVVTVRDIGIAYTVVGEGTPLIVVHGAAGLGSAYMRALDGWAEEFGLVYYDQRGSGLTPLGDPRDDWFTGGVEDLDGLRVALGFDTVNIVGHSAGAHLAALYASLHPESTSTLVLLNAGPPVVPALMQRFGQAMSARRTPADDAERRAIEESEAFRANQPAALERHQLNTFIPFFRDRATVDTVSLGFTEITAATVQVAPARVMASLNALNPMQRYAEISCPTLVVHSERDPIPVEWSRLLADTIPGADYVLLENASHFSMIEDEDELRASVLPWLSKRSS
jgi:pimeloyl-ACP methyl ester carboxylesterase